MLKRFFRKWKIRQLTRLLKDLRRQYGKKRYYSKLEVERSLKRKKFIRSAKNMSINDCYAYAMYCSPQLSSRACSAAGVDISYKSMRCDISEVVFGQQRQFDTSSLEQAVQSNLGPSNEHHGEDHGSGEL
ncbi:DUF6559 family protein [Corallincola platygyrae]|uniref:DUF6559 family protein n=1 Tax=Corallincola platygyrae TaxID=1193278 RepID=A0ABW4XNM3_9GAMM